MAEEQPKTSRLRRFLGLAGGITLADANARADMHLHLMQGRLVEEIHEALQALGQLLAEGGTSDAAARERMHGLAVMITGLGGTFGREGLSKAGYSLCRLLDMLGDQWDEEAVQIHWNAMNLLFNPKALPAAEQDELLAGLKKLCERAAARRAAALSAA